VIVHKSFVYLRLEKTGSMFLKKFLMSKMGGSEKLQDIGAIGLSGHFGLAKKPRCFVFGGIRNPWDWYVSFWLMLLKSGQVNQEYFVKGDDFRTFMLYTLTEKKGRGLYFNYDRIHELNIGLLSHEYFRIFGLMKPEPYRVEICKESIDDVYRMENMIPSFIEMFEKNVRKLNPAQKRYLLRTPKYNTTEHKHYSGYYDDELIRLVQEREQHITDKYGYKFEDG